MSKPRSDESIMTSTTPFTVDPNFQTPPPVCAYMVSLLPSGTGVYLEPTPGLGGLVKALSSRGQVVVPKDDFWLHDHSVRYDAIVMNPPFTPMAEGFRYLKACMSLSDNIIALLPWFILINSEARMEIIKQYGLISVTHLPRKTFPNSRIQCCVLQLKKGYSGPTQFKHFTWS